MRGDLCIHVRRTALPLERGLTAGLVELLLSSQNRAGDLILVAATLLQPHPNVALIVLPDSWSHGIAEVSPDYSDGSFILYGHLREQARIQVDPLQGLTYLETHTLPTPQLSHLVLLSSVLALDPIRQSRLLSNLPIECLIQSAAL